MHSFGVNPKFRIAKLGLKKLEASFYGMVYSIFRYLEPLGMTDKRDRQRDSRDSAAKHFVFYG